MKSCIVCEKEVDWSSVIEEFEDMFNQVDRYGVPSLTEQEQYVYEGRLCSHKCYEVL